MRYLLMVVLTCTPLAALTGLSFWQAARGPAASNATSAALDTGEVTKRSAATAEAAKQQEAFVAELLRANLLDANAEALADPADDKLKSAAEGWNHSRQARELAAKFARAVGTNLSDDAPPAVRRRELEAAIGRLHEFISKERSNYVGQVEGADELFAMLDRRVHQFQAEIDSYKRKDRVAEAVASVKNDLEQGRYEACLKRLNTEPLAAANDPDLVDELQLLRKRAEYRRAWEDLEAKNPQASGDRDLFNQIEAFLRRYPDPPTPAERDLQTQIESRRDHLKSEMSVSNLDQARDLDTLLVEAAAIVSNAKIEEAVKQHARHQVTEWLANHLPKIAPPASLLGKQEAVTKSGQRKIGVFFLPPGAEQYRFWAERRDRSERPRGDEQFARGSFEQEPTTPQYVVWAQQYNKNIETVLGAGADRADWQAFADDCDSWQQQLAAYRERWGIDDEPDRSCREWSFRDASAIGRSVLRRWEQYEAIAAPAQ